MPPSDERKVPSTRPDSSLGPNRDPLEQIALDVALNDPDRRLGKFVITGELGRGGMGVVYRGHDPDLGRDVALKVLWSRGKSGKRFRTEAETAARIQHPNVVRVHEVGEHKGFPYLVMDLVPGETLADRTQREGRLDARLAARVTLEIARALEAAHARGVLHRDVKPSNVLFAETGEAQLTDFGLAKDLSGGAPGLSTSGGFLGTAGFAPPEQATGALAQIGPASDVYGLGATLYYALTKRAPVRGETFRQVLLATCEEEPDPPSARHPGLDAELEQICLRCLAKKPGDRYPSAAALARELEGWLGEGRRRSWLPLAVAGPVLATGALVFALLPSSTDPTSPVMTTSHAPLEPSFEQARQALSEGDPNGALTALLPFPSEEDEQPERLALAEEAIAAQPPSVETLSLLNRLVPGTTRARLRCLAALHSGELEPTLGELSKLSDRPRRQYFEALDLERLRRDVIRLLEPIDGGWKYGLEKDELRAAGLQLFGRAQRLFVELPESVSSQLKPGVTNAAARMLFGWADTFGGDEEILVAAKLLLPLTDESSRDQLRIALFVARVKAYDPTVDRQQDLPVGRDHDTLPPLFAYTLHRHSVHLLPLERQVRDSEGMLKTLAATPELQQRFTRSGIHERLRLIQVHRRSAWEGRQGKVPPDPDGPHLQRALAVGAELCSKSSEEEAKVEHALTLILAGQDLDLVRETLRFIHEPLTTWYRELLFAELDLLEGRLEECVTRCDRLLDETVPGVPLSDARTIRAHARTLQGDNRGAKKDLRQARSAQEASWIPWRKPNQLPELMRGERWWPGAPR